MRLSDTPEAGLHALLARLSSKPATATSLIKQRITELVAASNQAGQSDVDRFVESLQSQEFAAVMSSWMEAD
jgi:hypothetical protein